MKKLLLSLVSLTFAFAAKADYTVTLDFTGWDFQGAADWKSSYDPHSVAFDHATVNFAKADRQADGNIIDDCPVTKGNDITVTADADIVSTTVVLKQWGTKTKTAQLWSGDNKLAETSDFLFDNVAVGASSYVIKFTEASNQVGLQKIVLTLAGEAPTPGDVVVESPVITPDAGSFYDPQTVTITAAEGLAIYYTLDGSVPTVASTLYEAPFQVSQTTTVRAIACNAEGVASNVVTAVITITKSIANTPETAYSVARAFELVDAGEDLDTKVYVKGTISSIKEIDTGNYGNATYFISDDGTATKEFEVYRGYSLGNNKFTSNEEIKVGDVVIVYGKIVKFYETYEFTTGSYIYSINGSTSAIQRVKEEQKLVIDPMTDVVFNVCGKRVTDISHKGIYIVNGKKYVVR